MTNEQIIRILEKNRNANHDHPNFVKACDAAITAIKENRQLKNRCFVLSKGTLCLFCPMECEHSLLKHIHKENQEWPYKTPGT